MDDRKERLMDLNASGRTLMQELRLKRRELDDLMTQAVSLLAEMKGLDRSVLKEISETFKEYHEMI